VARATAEGLAYKTSGDSTIVSELTDALWTAESCGDDADVARAGAYLVFAERYVDKQPERWAHLTNAALKRIGGDTEIEATLANNLGVVLHHRGDYAAGVMQYRRAVALAETLPGGVPLGLYLESLSDGLKEMGMYEEALAASDRALEIVTAAMGSNSLTFAQMSTNRGDLLAAMGRFEAAEAVYRRSLTIMERRLPAGNFGLTYPIAGIGKALVERGWPGDAVPWLERAASRDTGGDPYFAAGIKFDLARALCAAELDCARGRTFAFAALAAYRENPKFRPEEEQVAAWMRGNGSRDRGPSSGNGE
jgi:tetratricopeptide (TPR) repeat protein